MTSVGMLALRGRGQAVQPFKRPTWFGVRWANQVTTTAAEFCLVTKLK